jgi:hypothetical protein
MPVIVNIFREVMNDAKALPLGWVKLQMLVGWGHMWSRLKRVLTEAMLDGLICFRLYAPIAQEMLTVLWGGLFS